MICVHKPIRLQKKWVNFICIFMWFQNGSNEVVIELRVVSFLSVSFHGLIRGLVDHLIKRNKTIKSSIFWVVERKLKNPQKSLLYSAPLSHAVAHTHFSFNEHHSHCWDFRADYGPAFTQHKGLKDVLADPPCAHRQGLTCASQKW